MSSNRKHILAQVFESPAILFGSLIVLALCWWAMPFHLFPNWHPAVPSYYLNGDGSSNNVADWNLGLRVSFWFLNLGWDKGPPPEFAYDFIVFWHIALSLLVYLTILMWPANYPATGTPIVEAKLQSSRNLFDWMLWRYPLLCQAVLWFFPWANIDSDLGAQKVFALIIEPALLASITLLAWKFAGRIAFQRLIHIFILISAALAIYSPISGEGPEFLFLFCIVAGMSVWAKSSVIQPLDRILPESRSISTI